VERFDQQRCALEGKMNCLITDGRKKECDAQKWDCTNVLWLLTLYFLCFSVCI
jgi:hypothetical protein